MNISAVSHSESQGTNYKGVVIESGATKWSFLKVSGILNYVSIRKVSSNPFGSPLGKEFVDFDQAQEHYKSPQVKSFILVAESLLK